MAYKDPVNTLILETTKGNVVIELLADLAPGARFPTHDHAGSEQLYILSGHLHTEGRIMGPGDFLHAEAGTHHGELHSPDGCRALLVERVPAEMLSQMGLAS